MKKNVMKKWVKALVSGKYKQGRGLLKQTNQRNKTHHCCLGVLCELYNDQMKQSKKKMLSEKTNDIGIHKFNGNDEMIPVAVRRWAGLKDCNGSFRDGNIGDSFYFSLAYMNDFGCSFKKIAKTIEKQWRNL